jgi:hypothetical protein
MVAKTNSAPARGKAPARPSEPARPREPTRPSEPLRSRRQQRLDRVDPGLPKLRVEPATDTMRAILRHPSAGGFRGAGAAEWPDDPFTQRRLRDGDITLASDQRRKA